MCAFSATFIASVQFRPVLPTSIYDTCELDAEGLTVIAKVMLLTSGNSGMLVTGKQANYNIFHMLLQRYGRSPKAQGAGQRRLNYFMLKAEGDFVMCRYLRQKERREKRRRLRIGVIYLFVKSKCVWLENRWEKI